MNMIPFRKRWEFPEPSMEIFFSLQVLDVLTTLIGLRLGAGEASFFVARMISLGPLAGLLVAKCFALILVAAAIRFKRTRVIVFLNYWFAAIITWNLVTILRTALVR